MIGVPTDLNPRNALQWVFFALMVAVGVFVVANAARWVLVPASRKGRFRDLSSAPAGDRIFFVFACALQAGVGGLVAMIGLSTLVALVRAVLGK